MKLNDITYVINGAVFEVNDILGPGFLEKVYNFLILNLIMVLHLKAPGLLNLYAGRSLVYFLYSFFC